MRGRREHFVWGPRLLVLLQWLKTSQIKGIERTCRSLLAQVAALTLASGEDPPNSFAFPSDGGRYRLDKVGFGKLWVAEVLRAPPNVRAKIAAAKKGKAAAEKASTKKAATKKTQPTPAKLRPKSTPAMRALQASRRRVEAAKKTVARTQLKPRKSGPPGD